MSDRMSAIVLIAFAGVIILGSYVGTSSSLIFQKRFTHLRTVPVTLLVFLDLVIAMSRSRSEFFISVMSSSISVDMRLTHVSFIYRFITTHTNFYQFYALHALGLLHHRPQTVAWPTPASARRC